MFPILRPQLSFAQRQCISVFISGGQMLDDEHLNSWFRREILPLESLLQGYLRRNWRSSDDIVELRQDVYERVLIGARKGGVPADARAYLFTVARNHLINRAKRAKIVSFEALADLEVFEPLADGQSGERYFIARDELRHAKAGIEKLPPRCREVIRLRKIEGMTAKETAVILGVTTDTINQQLKYGMKALIDHMLGGPGKIVRNIGKIGSRNSEAGQ